MRAIREHLILKEIRKPKKKDSEKLPPEQDFFAAGDAAKEEINRLGKLMHENNDRVKRMEETISNHKHVVEVKDAKDSAAAKTSGHGAGRGCNFRKTAETRRR